MTASEFDAMKALLRELRRKLWLAETSSAASTKRGQRTIATRKYQALVVERLLNGETV